MTPYFGTATPGVGISYRVVPPGKIPDLPRLYPTLIQSPDDLVNPQDLCADALGSIIVIERIRPCHNHLERIADMVRKDGKLLQLRSIWL